MKLYSYDITVSLTHSFKSRTVGGGIQYNKVKLLDQYNRPFYPFTPSTEDSNDNNNNNNSEVLLGANIHRPDAPE